MKYRIFGAVLCAAALLGLAVRPSAATADDASALIANHAAYVG
jgi:hypothetical protein